MTLQLINTGTSANAGNGDSIRTAFAKVNNNFDYLNGLILCTGTTFDSSVQDVVKPMLVHDSHQGITAQYNPITERIVLTVGNLTNAVYDNLFVANTTTLRDVVMTGTVAMGFIQGFDDVSIIKYATDGSLNFRMRNTYGPGSSEINLLDQIDGAFNIVHQNSGVDSEFFSFGQNYIFDDRGRGINIGRASDIKFYADQNWNGYTNPAVSIYNTGSVVINSTLTLAQNNFNLGGKRIEVGDGTLYINGSEISPLTDKLTAGDFTTTLTTAGSLVLPGNTVIENRAFVQPGQVITNYGATFSSESPFDGVGSIYFDGNSRIEVAGGSHFDLITGTYTIEWFQKPTEFEDGPVYTVYVLGNLENQTISAFNTVILGNTGTWTLLEGSNLTGSRYSDILNTWTHVAIVKTPTTYSMYINGSQALTTSTNSWPVPATTSSALAIGAVPVGVSYQDAFIGYISNMRWEAREVYTGTFTPPTSKLIASADTKLLLTTDNAESYLWDTSGLVPAVPQELTFVLRNSSLKVNHRGEVYLDQEGAYDGTDLLGTTIRVDTSQPNYTQIFVKNHNSGTTATSDLMIFNNTSTIDSGYIDLGINSTNYTEGPYGLHAPGSGYLFTKDVDLVIGSVGLGSKLVFHAGGDSVNDSAAELNAYTWKFNRSVQTIVSTPGPLNFTVWNTQNNAGAQAVYQAINDIGNLVHFGINSSNPGAYYGNIGPNESFIHNHNHNSTLHIGGNGNLVFYSDELTGFSGSPTLVMSRVDRSSTFGGHVLPASDLTYDLGSTSTQWRNLYVGTSTVYFGGIPLSVTPDGGILVNDIPVSGGAANTGDVTFNGVKIIGAGTASGDGLGYSTLELVPDGTLNTDQYIVVDPTAPNHIHLRAGGTQDASTAALFLGGELNYARVTDGNGVRLNNAQFIPDSVYFEQGVDYDTATWSTDESGNHWIDIVISDPFNPTRSSDPINTASSRFTQYPQNRIEVFTGSSLYTVSGNGQAYTLGNPYNYRIGTTEAPPENPTTLTSLDYRLNTFNERYLYLENNQFELYANTANVYADQTIDLVAGTGNIRVTTDDNNSSQSWYFTAQGYLQFPQGVGPTTSKGKEGDTAGSVVFDGTYIYYCTTDYTDGVADIWKRVAWSNDTW